MFTAISQNSLSFNLIFKRMRGKVYKICFYVLFLLSCILILNSKASDALNPERIADILVWGNAVICSCKESYTLVFGSYGDIKYLINFCWNAFLLYRHETEAPFATCQVSHGNLDTEAIHSTDPGGGRRGTVALSLNLSVGTPYLILTTKICIEFWIKLHINWYISWFLKTNNFFLMVSGG